MKTTEKNALIVFALMTVFTAGFYWLVEIKIGWDAPWWMYAVVFMAGGAKGLADWNQRAAMDNLANMNDPQRQATAADGPDDRREPRL